MQCSRLAFVYIYMYIYICMYIEEKIYSRADIISDRRLQKYKHGSNCAKSSEQTRYASAGIVFDTRKYCSTRG